MTFDFKKCSNQQCLSEGSLLTLDAFHRKGNGYSSRCKLCVNKGKREKRRKDKKKIIQSFNINVMRVNPCGFVDGFRLLLEEGNRDE
jgi:hypothetical protein